MIKRILKNAFSVHLTKTFFAFFYLFCISYTAHALANGECLVDGQCKLHVLYKHIAAFILASSFLALAFNIFSIIFWERVVVRISAMGLMSVIIYISWEAAIDPEVPLSYMKIIADRIFIVSGIGFGFLYRAMYLKNKIVGAITYKKKYETLNSESK